MPFGFREPVYLFLLPVAALAFLACFAGRTPDALIPSGLFMKKTGRRISGRLPYFLLAAAVLSAVIALCRPWISIGLSAGRGKAAAALVLDLSGSMEGRDWAGGGTVPELAQPAELALPRIDRAKAIALELLDSGRIDCAALAVFSGRAYLAAPLTREIRVIRERISRLESLVYEDGTAVGDGVLCGVNALETAVGGKNIILISDGADHDSAENLSSAAAAAVDAGCVIHTVAVGSGTVFHPVPDGSGEILWKRGGEPWNPEILRSTAAATGGVFAVSADEIPDALLTKPEPDNRFALENGFLYLALLLIICAGWMRIR